MPVRLDQVPPVAKRPGRPRVWLWIGALVLLVMAGLAAQVLLIPPPEEGRPIMLGPVVFLPAMIWAAVAGLRAMIFAGQQRSADGWDEVRDEDLAQRISCGRRSLDVLGASLHTALRAPDSDTHPLLDLMLGDEPAIKSQVTRLGGVARHSRLPGDVAEAPEDVLDGALRRVLGDLAPALAQFPQDSPIALLLTVETCVPEETLQDIWKQAWQQSGIRHAPVPVAETGMAAVDQWLDQRAADQSPLMVIALQIAPSNADATAEAAVGLLLANPTNHSGVTRLACLHRPEPEREQEDTSLIRAMRQALDWVPLQPEQVGQVWRAGVDGARNAAIAAQIPAALPTADAKPELIDLDALLGHAGPAAPWLPLAAAALNLQHEAKPQFVLSGEGSGETALWGMVLTPVPARP